MPGDASDPVIFFRRSLQECFLQLRRPTYRSLELHAGVEGRALRPSTLSGLLNGPAVPRWSTVETFLRAAAGYVQARRLRVAPDLTDLDRWSSHYQAMENALADRAAERERATIRGGRGRRRRPVTPAQLPADVAAFTGRADELTCLDRLLADDPGASSAAARVAAIDGPPGVGKTALALHWAHRAADRFPDGQLYVNLHGYDPDLPLDPADALAGFLRALGVPDTDVPAGSEERAARYRTELAGRRVLVLVDNAATVEHVRPLLPGAGPAAVLVTSRDSLAGLVVLHGARRIDLDLLPPDDAAALLRRLIPAQAETDARAVADLADRCGRLPLALRVAAELAAFRPESSLAELVVELGDDQQRLDLLDAGGDARAAVTTVFSWSYRHLAPEVAELFRLLGLHPGHDIEIRAAAALVGDTVGGTRRRLAALVRAHLVAPVGRGRYAMHDLLRVYATGLAATMDGPVRRAALTRLFDFYLAAAAEAMNGQAPSDRSWLDAERANLIAVAAHCASTEWPAHAVSLSRTLFWYLNGGHHADAVALHGHADHAARRLGDPAGRAQSLAYLGAANLRLGLEGPAVDCLEQSLRLFRQVGDEAGLAGTLTTLGDVEQRLGRYRASAEHHRVALALFRRTGDRVGEAHALTKLGIVAERLGRYGAAADHHDQALGLFRRDGDHAGVTAALSNLGDVEGKLGRHDLAAEHLEEAVARYREAGNRDGEAWALDNLGGLLTRLGRPDVAAEHHRRALAVHRHTGERFGEASALNGLGEAARQAPDTLAYHAAAREIAAAIGDRHQLARAHAGLGDARARLGEAELAREHYRQALAVYTDLDTVHADDIRTRLVLT